MPLDGSRAYIPDDYGVELVGKEIAYLRTNPPPAQYSMTVNIIKLVAQMALHAAASGHPKPELCLDAFRRISEAIYFYNTGEGAGKGYIPFDDEWAAYRRLCGELNPFSQPDSCETGRCEESGIWERMPRPKRAASAKAERSDAKNAGCVLCAG
jgi:hypothetical protein